MKTTTVFRPLVNLQTAEDLKGTILDPRLMETREYIPVSVPVAGFYQDLATVKIYLKLIAPQFTEDGRPIVSPLARAADNLVQAALAYRAADEDSVLLLKERFAIYRRVVLQQFKWALNDASNPRDSVNNSSAYLVGVPFILPDGILTGKVTDLADFEVAINPRLASKLNVVSGDIVLLRRFPETKCLPVKVRISRRVPKYCLGLPVSDLMNLLGGDLDGDCYVLQAFFEEECVKELIHVYSSAVATYGTLYNLELKLLGYKDEKLSGLSDEMVADSKRKQKVLVGPCTIDGYSTFVIKSMAGDRLSLSFEQLRKIMERSLEVVMDTKKAPTHSDGTLWDPMLLRNVLNNEAVGMAAEEVTTKLTEQGYNVDDIRALIRFAAEHDKSLRQLAYLNSGYRATRGGHEEAESFIRGLKSKENVGEQFVDCLYGRKLIKGAQPTRYQRIKRPARKYGFWGFRAQMNGKGQIEVACGLGRHSQATMLGGKALVIDPNGTEVAMFRRTVEVILQPAKVRVLAAKLDQSVERLEKLRDDKAVRRLKARYGRVDVEGSEYLCLFHRTWCELLEAMADSADFTFDVQTIIREPDAIKASELLTSLVRRMLRRMYKTYQVRGGDFQTWEALAGAHKIVVVNFERDDDRPEDVDIFSAKMLVGEVAGKFLESRRLINNLSDTISGDPGTAYYLRKDEHANFVTQFDTLSHFIAYKRMPVSAALGNIQEIAGVNTPSIKQPKASAVPPMREVWTAGLPFDLKDAILFDPSFKSGIGNIKIPKVIKGLDFGSYDYFKFETGCKMQSFIDAKGVGAETKLPIAEFADGTRVQVEVAFGMTSASHEMLRHTHGTLALTAAAWRMHETTGYQMSVPANVSMERIAKVAQASGLYDDDTLTARLINPETGEYITYSDESGTTYDRFPVGRASFGVHRQIPEVISSSHSRDEEMKDYMPTSTSDGGVVSGIAGAFCLAAEGMQNCLDEIHTDVNPALAEKIDALANSLVWDTAPAGLSELPSNSAG